MFDYCECCGRELKDKKTKFWEERHMIWSGTEFQGTIRRMYYSDKEYCDEVCSRCYRILTIKRILIRMISWGFAFFFIVGFFIAKGNTLIRVISFISFIFGFFMIVYDRFTLYSIIGTILSPFLGRCEMHPFGKKYTIRERREHLNSIESKINKLERYLAKQHNISKLEAAFILLDSNLQYDMEENYPQYKHKKLKDLALMIIPDDATLNKKLDIARRNIKKTKENLTRIEIV